AGILRNAKAMEHANVSRWVEVPLPCGAAAEAALRKHEAAVAGLESRIKSARARPADGKGRPVKALEDELKKLRQTGPRRPMAMSVVEEKAIEDARVH